VTAARFMLKALSGWLKCRRVLARVNVFDVR
jgi:hypothetical protein